MWGGRQVRGADRWYMEGGTPWPKQAALRDLEAEDIEDIWQRLKDFVGPFQDVLVREEQRRHLAVYVEGRLTLLRQGPEG